MGMRIINVIYSPCEVIRCINDEIQGDSEKDKKIRRMLSKLLKMNKAMSDKLDKYEPKHSFVWKERTPNWRHKLENRISKFYKVDK